MKIKYYLRGLGIGIAVTAFIMSFMIKNEKMSDEQIKKRAFELGMIEETVLADLSKSESEKEQKISAEEAEKEKIKEESFEYTAGEAEIFKQEEQDPLKEESSVKDGVEETVLDGEEDQENLPKKVTEDKEERKEELKEEAEEKYVIISIEPGNGSESVCRRLYNMGLVESAVEFNRFLVEHNYDTRLIVGNHEIPIGVTEEKIAEILCGIEIEVYN